MCVKLFVTHAIEGFQIQGNNVTADELDGC